MAEKLVARERIYKEVQSHAGNPELTGAPEESLLTQFLLIAEWEAPNGDRWISKLSGDAFRELPDWRERGLAAEVVHGTWDGNDDDD